MDGAADYWILRSDNQEQTIADDVKNHDELRCVLRQIFEEEAAEYCGQNRQTNQHDKRIQERLEACWEEVYHRTYDCRSDGKDNADVLANLNQLHLRSFRIDVLMINVHGEHGIY